MYLSYCGVECLLLFYIPPVSRRFPGFFYTCELRRKEPAKWKHMFQVTFCIIILQLGTNHLLNSPRAFAFVNNQQNCFLPDCCCFLPVHWGPLGLSITSQINRVNMTAKQSPPIFKRSWSLIFLEMWSQRLLKIPPNLQRAIPFGEREEVLY